MTETKPASILALLDSSIDYAGMFLPAKLPVDDMLRSWAAARRGEHAGLLGRLVVPSHALDAVEDLAPRYLTDEPRRPWPLSVVLGEDPEAELDLVRAFNDRLRGGAEVVSVEVMPLSTRAIDRVGTYLSPGIEAFFEVPLDGEVEARLAIIASGDFAAKVRTGGVTAAAFPDAARLGAFVASAAGAQVPFKATAGLHHPFAGQRPAAGAGTPSVAMHGFLNLAVAAVLCRVGAVEGDEIIDVLGAPRDAFEFRDVGLAYRGLIVDVDEIAAARRALFRSFGSCSFDEPIEELRTEGLL